LLCSIKLNSKPNCFFLFACFRYHCVFVFVDLNMKGIRSKNFTYDDYQKQFEMYAAAVFDNGLPKRRIQGKINEHFTNLKLLCQHPLHRHHDGIYYLLTKNACFDLVSVLLSIKYTLGVFKGATFCCRRYDKGENQAHTQNKNKKTQKQRQFAFRKTPHTQSFIFSFIPISYSLFAKKKPCLMIIQRYGRIYFSRSSQSRHCKLPSLPSQSLQR